VCALPLPPALRLSSQPYSVLRLAVAVLMLC
jgi:hypothetical protein